MKIVTSWPEKKDARYGYWREESTDGAREAGRDAGAEGGGVRSVIRSSAVKRMRPREEEGAEECVESLSRRSDSIRSSSS